MPTYYSGAGTTADPRKYYSDQGGTAELSPDQSKNIDITNAIPIKQALAQQISEATQRYNWSEPTAQEKLAKKVTTDVEDPAAIEERITQQKEANIQGQIEQIEKASKAKEEEILTAGKIDLSRTNALSALMGLTGSESANTREAESGQRTQKNIDLERQSKALKISQLYSQADANAEKEIEAAKETNRQNAEKLLSEVATNAENTVKGLASVLNGKTWDDFRAADPDKAQQLLNQTKKSEYELKSIWNSAIPEQYRPITGEAFYSSPDGKQTIVHSYSINKSTGKTTDNTYTIDIPFASFKPDLLVKGTNGQLLMPMENGSYKDVTPGKPVTLAQGTRLVDPTTGKTIAEGAPKTFAPKSAGSTNKLTLNEATTRGLPLSLVGMSEDQIAQDLTSESAPEWFKASMQEKTGVIPQKTQLDEAWKTFQDSYVTEKGVLKKQTGGRAR